MAWPPSTCDTYAHAYGLPLMRNEHQYSMLATRTYNPNRTKGQV
jgi:hypothetical protein